MDWKEEMKKVLAENKKMLALFLLVIPMVIHAMYKFSLGPKFMEGAFGAGDLLGFYGEVLGGFVTLLVLWITTDETRKIQQKNEQQLEDDRKEREWERRKYFTDSVADDISKFVAETVVFADKYRNFVIAEKNKVAHEAELQEIIKQIDANYNEMAEKDDVDYKDASKNNELEQKKAETLRRIEVCERHMETLYIDSSRVGALERYTALCLKLHGMRLGRQILNKMDDINEAARDATVEFEKLGPMQDDLLTLVDVFTKQYLEKG